MNSFESLYTKGVGISNGVQNRSYEDGEESLFDGDFDALICDARSTENMLEFAEIYQNLRTINADAKIKMCKKLRNITRGYTKYQDSIESYLNHEISMEEAQKEENSDNDKVEDKPENENSEKKAAWYIRIWEGIKKVFRAIWKWILERINAIKNHFRKNEDSLSNDEMNQIKNENPEAFNDFVNGLNSLYYESKSEDGAIKLEGNTADSLSKSIQSYETLCKKLVIISNEISNTDVVKADYFNHMMQILQGACSIVSIKAPPMISNFDKDSVNDFQKSLNNYAHELEYTRDPQRYVKIFAGSTILTGDKVKLTDIIGKSTLKEGEPICRNIVNLLSNTSKSIMSIEKSIETASNVIINKFKRAKNTAINGNGSIQEIKDDDKNRDEKIHSLKIYACITSLSKVLCKISGIIQKIIGKVLAEANEIVTKIENAENELKKKISYKVGRAIKSVKDKVSNIKKKPGEVKKSFDNGKNGKYDNKNEEEDEHILE